MPMIQYLSVYTPSYLSSFFSSTSILKHDKYLSRLVCFVDIDFLRFFAGGSSLEPKSHTKTLIYTSTMQRIDVKAISLDQRVGLVGGIDWVQLHGYSRSALLYE